MKHNCPACGYDISIELERALVDAQHHPNYKKRRDKIACKGCGKVLTAVWKHKVEFDYLTDSYKDNWREISEEEARRRRERGH